MRHFVNAWRDEVLINAAEQLANQGDFAEIRLIGFRLRGCCRWRVLGEPIPAALRLWLRRVLREPVSHLFHHRGTEFLVMLHLVCRNWFRDTIRRAHIHCSAAARVWQRLLLISKAIPLFGAIERSPVGLIGTFFE